MSVYRVLHVGREAEKLFNLRMFVHSSRKINAEIVPDLLTHGIRERFWGEDIVCCLCYTSFPQGLFLATMGAWILS